MPGYVTQMYHFLQQDFDAETDVILHVVTQIVWRDVLYNIDYHDYDLRQCPHNW